MQNIGQYQKPKLTANYSIGLLSELSLVDQTCSHKRHLNAFIPATNIKKPVSGLQGQDTGPGRQLGTPSDCIPIEQAGTLCFATH